MIWRRFGWLVWLPSVVAGEPAERKALGDLVGVWRADFNHDASRVVVEMRSNKLGIWDVVTGQPVAGDLGSLEASGSYIVGPEAKRVLVSLGDGNSRVFDMETAKAVSPVLGVDFDWGWSQRVFFTRDGGRIVFIDGGRCRVFSSETGQQVVNFKLASASDDQSVRPDVALSEDGKVAMILDGAAVLQRYDAADWKPLGPLMLHPERDCFHAGFSMSEDAKYAVTFDYPGENGPHGLLQLWDAENGKPLGNPLSAVNGMAGGFFDGGRKLLIMPGRGRVSVVDVPDFEKPVELPMHDDVDAGKAIVSSDGRRILTWGYDYRISSTDVKTGQTVSYRTSKAHVTDVLVGPDPTFGWVVMDNTAFSLLRHYDYYIFRLRLLDMKPVATLRVTDFLHRTILSPDGKTLMIHEGGTDRERIRVFDAMSLEELLVAGDE